MSLPIKFRIPLGAKDASGVIRSLDGRLVHLCRKDFDYYDDDTCLLLEENPEGSGDYEAELTGDDWQKFYPEYVLYINHLKTTKEIKAKMSFVTSLSLPPEADGVFIPFNTDESSIPEFLPDNLYDVSSPAGGERKYLPRYLPHNRTMIYTTSLSDRRFHVALHETNVTINSVPTVVVDGFIVHFDATGDDEIINLIVKIEVE